MTLTARKSTPDIETRAGLRFMVQTDLYALAKVLLHGDRPETANHITEGFHRPLCQVVQTTPWAKNLYILPRDHLKTTLITIARNVQQILVDPQTRILIASNKAENADAMLSELKGHLLHPMLLWAFPDILYPDPARQAEKWTTSAIVVKRTRRTKEATIETIGVEGEMTSKHYNHGTFDDLVGFENSQTRDQLARVINWYRTAQSLFEPEATQDIVGTPWTGGDLIAWLIEQKIKGGLALGVYRQPVWQTTHAGELRVDTRGALAPDDVVLDADGHEMPALPERFTYATLQARKKLVGGVVWAAQYLINPTDDETAVFPRSKAVIVPRDRLPDPAHLWCVMTVDPAISTKAWADFSAIAVAGFDAHGRMLVLDLRRGKWSETELVDQIYDAFQRTPGIRMIGFEAIGFQKIYRRELTRAGETRGFLPILALERDTKINKNIRIRALQPFWERQEIILASDLPALDDFLDEAERFRLYRESLHDDMLDALADAIQLRIRPAEQDDKPEMLLDDPALYERQQFEWSMNDARRKAGMPLLDRSALRMAFSIHKHHEVAQQYQTAAVMGAGRDEFWGP